MTQQLLTVKAIHYGNSVDTQITVSRELTADEEHELRVLAKLCKTQVVAIIADYPLINPMPYTYRIYCKQNTDLARDKHVYTYGNTDCIPAQCSDGYVRYACAVVLFERNGIWYTTRVKAEGTNKLALVSFNFTTNNTHELMELISQNVFYDSGIYASQQGFHQFAQVKHSGGNATIGARWTMIHYFYYCVLSQDETDSVFAKYNVDDCPTDNQVNHYHSRLRYTGDNMIRDNRVVIIPVAGASNKTTIAGYKLHDTTEYIAAKALLRCGYEGSVYTKYMHDYKLNGKPAVIEYC